MACCLQVLLGVDRVDYIKGIPQKLRIMLKAPILEEESSPSQPCCRGALGFRLLWSPRGATELLGSLSLGAVACLGGRHQVGMLRLSHQAPRR